MATAAGSGTLALLTTSRTVADGVTNSTTTITSATAAFVAGDVGRIVTGSADLPANVYIASVTNGTTAVLSQAATASHTGQTFNLTAEYALLNIAAAGTYTLHFDSINLAANDIVEVRVYQKILTGGTPRVAYFQSFQDAQAPDDVIKISVPIANDLTDTVSLQFTLKQTAGTGRSVPWKVLSY